MESILFIFAPAFMVTLGLLLGIVFKYAQIEVRGKKAPIPLIVFCMLSSIGLYLAEQLLASTFLSIELFASFAALFENNALDIIKYNAALVGIIILIFTFEGSLICGFSIARGISKKHQKKHNEPSVDAQPQANTEDKSVDSMLTPSAFTKDQDVARLAEEQGLRRDEQSLMELIVYGKVNQITSVASVGRPEGYYYDGIPQLDWETKRTKKVLDSLVRKSYLNAELTDKLIVCQACGSANVRVRTICPECNSLRLHKEALLEHFSCGAVDRQSAFASSNGDLICPKCKTKLQLIGSDYRALPPAYLCLGCNTLNSQPLLTTKCEDCGSNVLFDEEPEILLYKYSANPNLPMHELQQIKPLDACTTFFKSLGYNIVAPAFVSGRSGTQHLFDVLILGRVGWIEPTLDLNNGMPRNNNGNTVVEILVASKPIDVEEITRIYGKISDIDCDFILFAIPGLTQDARNYADVYRMKVSEGKDIEEALANSRIPQANGNVAGPQTSSNGR